MVMLFSSLWATKEPYSKFIEALPCRLISFLPYFLHPIKSNMLDLIYLPAMSSDSDLLKTNRDGWNSLVDRRHFDCCHGTGSFAPVDHRSYLYNLDLIIAAKQLDPSQLFYLSSFIFVSVVASLFARQWNKKLVLSALAKFLNAHPTELIWNHCRFSAAGCINAGSFESSERCMQFLGDLYKKKTFFDGRGFIINLHEFLKR